MSYEPKTACLCPFSSPSWEEIEADRQASAATKAAPTVANATWRKVLASLTRIQDPAERRAAAEWVAYCVATLGTLKRPTGVDRRHVLRFALHGVVDPLGFDYGAEHRPATKRKRKGVFRGVAFERHHVAQAHPLRRF